MKKILTLATILIFVTVATAQTNNIWQSGGISQTLGAPTFKPGAKGNIVAIDTVTGIWYISRDRYAANGNWLSMGQRIEQISGCSAPAYTPNKYNSDLVINNCAVPELYYHSGGGVWACLNCSTTITTDATLSGAGTSGSPLKIAQQSATSGQVLKWNGTTWLPATDAGTTYTGGTGIDVTGTVISNTGDLSATNELNTAALVTGGNLRITDAGGNLDVSVSSIAPVQAVAAGTGISISGTTTRTVSSTITQADGSETVVNAGTGVSVSGAGTSGSPYVVSSTITQYTDENAQDAVGAMAGNTLTYTDATPLLDVKTQMSITSDASGVKLSGDASSPGNSKLYGTDGSGVKGWQSQPTGTTDLSISGTSSPLTINSSTGTDITATAGTGISLAGTSGNMTITNSSPSLWTDGGTDTYLTSTTDNVAIGATAAASKLDIITNSLGVTQTNTSGLLLSNTTAAAAGAQQISPAIRWRGNGWKTNATAASQTVDFRVDVLPVQGAANPDGWWQLYSSVNGGTYGKRFRVKTDGTTDIGNYSSEGLQIVPGTTGTNTASIITGGLTLGTNSGVTSGYGVRFQNNFSVSATGTSFQGVTGTVARTGTASGSVCVLGSSDFQGSTTTGKNYGTTFICGNNPGIAPTYGAGKLINVRLSTEETNYSASSNWKGNGAAEYVSMVIDPRINQQAGATGAIYGIDYNPVLDNLLGANYAALFRSGNVGINSNTPTEKLEVGGNISLTTAGNKLKIATGSNASIGTATLVAGTVTVSTTAVATGSIIIVSCNTPGGTQGILSAPVASITNATSFVINSSNAADTSTVNWWIVN